MMTKALFPVLACAFLTVIVTSCSNPTAAKSEEIGGWAVSRAADSSGTAYTSASKSFETTEYTGTFTFTGGEKAIADLLNGVYEIGFSSASGDTVMLANKEDRAAYTEEDKVSTVVNFTVNIQPKATAGLQAKTTNIGGSLAAGNVFWMQKSGVWWGMSAWVQPVSGNVDLGLWWSNWGTYQQVSYSNNLGTLQDQVSYTSQLFSDYKLNIIGVDTASTFTGQVSW
jgi:hypothetical protein